MDVETIRIKKTLKTGGKVWRKGLILLVPFPPEIVAELRADTKGETIEILKRVAIPEVVPKAASPRTKILRRLPKDDPGRIS